jgi:hypothetical protein
MKSDKANSRFDMSDKATYQDLVHRWQGRL